LEGLATDLEEAILARDRARAERTLARYRHAVELRAAQLDEGKFWDIVQRAGIWFVEWVSGERDTAPNA
jgi:hypothetical protein